MTTLFHFIELSFHISINLLYLFQTSIFIFKILIASLVLLNNIDIWALLR
jgi:hypothetical protein